MSISDSINGAISKGRDIVGAADALKGVLPPSLIDSLGIFIKGTNTPSNSRRNIEGLRSSLYRLGGIARTNLFYVSIPFPTMMGSSSVSQGGTTLTDSTLSLLCESASLPGVQLATSDIRRYGVGPMEKKPYSAIFVDQTLSFIGDNTGKVYNHFYTWMNGIIKYDDLPGNSPKTGYNGLNSYELEYKENYAVDITITCVNEVDQEIIVCKLIQAYPIFLGEVQLSWAENDTFMRIPAVFTFMNWKLDKININSALQNPGNNISTLQKLLQVGSAVQTLASLRKPTGIADIINLVNNAKIASGGLIGLSGLF
jgi:hypothetical protein